MAWQSRPQPTPGHPIARGGLPYIWATWLAKLLGGEQCVRRVWSLSRFKFDKLPDRDADKLQEWNREHNAMMRERRLLLESEGWTCESERDTRLEGKTAVIAGKEDLVARMPGHVLIVDGKTGKRREADVVQVALYMFARLHQPVVETTKLAGEVFYKSGRPVDVRIIDVQRYEPAIVEMVQRIADPTAPAPVPSKYECSRCPIRREDCPERFQEDTDSSRVLTEAF